MILTVSFIVSILTPDIVAEFSYYIFVIIHLLFERLLKWSAVHTHDQTNEFLHVIDLEAGAEVIAKVQIPNT